MAKICDRTACDNLLTAAGVWLHFSKEEGQWYITVTTKDGEKEEQLIEYCPFCGTRVDEVGDAAREKYMRPRRRRRFTPAPVAS